MSNAKEVAALKKQIRKSEALLKSLEAFYTKAVASLEGSLDEMEAAVTAASSDATPARAAKKPAAKAAPKAAAKKPAAKAAPKAAAKKPASKRAAAEDDDAEAPRASKSKVKNRKLKAKKKRSTPVEAE